jgi:hypothetical protein
LIIERVRGGDLVGFPFVHKLDEPTVAELASCGFETDLVGARVSRRIPRAQVEIQLQTAGEILDELLIGIGLGAANAVMEMAHRKHDAQFPAQFRENSEQRYRVRAAGDCHGYAVARDQQPFVANVLADTIDHQ